MWKDKLPSRPITTGSSGFIDRRAFLGGAIGVAGLLALAACSTGGGSASPSKTGVAAKKDGDTLNLYAWEGYFAPEVISGFEKKYGITVKQTSTASLDDMIVKLTSKQPFDIAIANSTFLPDVASAGLLRTIDHDKLSHWDEVISYFNNPYFDPGAKHSVGYAMAPVGLAYQKDKYSGMTGSWKDLWTHVDDDPGHVYLIDDYQLTLSIALMYDGVDPSEATQAQLNKAVTAIQSIRSKIGGFSSTNTTQSLSSGQATMLPSYTGNIYSALSQATTESNLTFQLCKEGQLFNDDVMTIPEAAKHPGNGMLFLNHMLAPENMAKNVNYIGYPVPTKTGMSTYDTLVEKTPFLAFGTSLFKEPNAWQKGLTPDQRTIWNAAWLKVQSS
jgi:spermidine/putrescine transport system substrate-binding protein